MNHKFHLTKSNIGKHNLTLNLLNYYKMFSFKDLIKCGLSDEIDQ